MASGYYTNRGAANRRPKVCKSPPRIPHPTPTPSSCGITPGTASVQALSTISFQTEFANAGSPTGSSTTQIPTPLGGTIENVSPPTNNTGLTGSFDFVADEVAGVFDQSMETIDQNGNSCIATCQVTITDPPSNCSLVPATANSPLGGSVAFVTTFTNTGTPTGTATTSNVTTTGGTRGTVTSPNNGGGSTGGWTWTATAAAGNYTQTVDITDRNNRTCQKTATVRIWNTITNCTLLNPAPAKWTFTLAGVTNGACGNCAVENRVWTLLNIAACVWQETPALAGPCNPALAPRSSLNVIAGATLLTFRTAMQGIGATYTGPAATNYFSPIVLTKTANNGNCATWPATITISPV